MRNLRDSTAAKWLVCPITGFGLILIIALFYQYNLIRNGVYAEVENTGKSVMQAFGEVVTADPKPPRL